MHLSYDEIRALSRYLEETVPERVLNGPEIDSDLLSAINRIRLRLGTHRARKVHMARQEEINNPYT